MQDRTVQELMLEMRDLWASFDENERVYSEKRTAAAAKRARIALGEMTKLITPYRKALVEEIEKNNLSHSAKIR